MISDEERREVAKRLRNGGIARNSEEAYVLLLSRIGIRPQLPAASTYEDAMVRLANLIDRPTCIMTYKPEWSGNEIYPTTAYQCSNCGCVVNEGITEYCPSCGCRVSNFETEPER